MSTKDSLYKDGFWYNNTYDSLGSDWLKDSLLKQSLKIDYVLINLSANEGKYEEDAYMWSICRSKVSYLFLKQTMRKFMLVCFYYYEVGRIEIMLH